MGGGGGGGRNRTVFFTKYEKKIIFFTAGICLFVGKINRRGCTLYIVHCTVVVVHETVEGHYDVASVYEKIRCKY